MSWDWRKQRLDFEFLTRMRTAWFSRGLYRARNVGVVGTCAGVTLTSSRANDQWVREGAKVRNVRAPAKDRGVGLRRRNARYPALSAWRLEFAKGERTDFSIDPLWRAACAEMSALEAEAAGLPGIATSFRRDAREIVRRAVREAAR